MASKTKAEPYHMTPEEIAPHQVPVRGVLFLGEEQAITGDLWRVYQAPDGEIASVRVKLGFYADKWGGCEPWTDDEARDHAILRLNQQRQGRAARMAAGEPVTCRLDRDGSLAARLHGGPGGR